MTNIIETARRQVERGYKLSWRQRAKLRSALVTSMQASHNYTDEELLNAYERWIAIKVTERLEK